MKSRITALLLMVVCLAGCLMGCVRTELDVSLSGDGTGILTTTAAITEEAYNTMKQTGADPFEGRETQRVIYDDVPYISCSESTEKLPFEELEAVLKDIRLDAADAESPPLFEDVSIDKNGGLFYHSFTFRAKTAAQNASEIQSSSDAYALFIKVTMPGRISQTKEGVTEGNTVTFEISDLSQSHEFAVFSDANSVGVIIGVIAVLAVVFAGVFFFTRKRG